VLLDILLLGGGLFIPPFFFHCPTKQDDAGA
jgi:hypothetical protein